MSGTALVCTTERLVAWSECDPAGIVYYPRYAEMCDANTNALFAQATGLGKRETQVRYGIVGWPMVSSSQRYLKPATYGDVVRVSSRVLKFGGSSIELSHRIEHQDGSPIAELTDTRVWAAPHPEKPGAIKAAPLPADFTACFFTEG